ncbi:MAG TPA: vWA domain-containing protein, partial [Methanomicrobiales archaeon]|nr:vWA domain-containing protein [Methanomicrobiales archaeon]
MKILAACIVCLVCLSSLAVPAAAADGGVGVNPATITEALGPGETKTIPITVTLPGSVPKGDVVFAFDTTGSMGQVLDAMKSQGIQVMNDIRGEIPDTRFGAASFMDYPYGYTSFLGYTCKDGNNIIPCVYGDPGDYAFLKNMDLTSDISAISSSIKGIPKGSGGDWPEDYARVIYESRNFSWRLDAKKIYVIFGDAPPHAAPNGSTLQKPWDAGRLFIRDDAPYGGDPGRDQVAYTDDDIDYDLAI